MTRSLKKVYLLPIVLCFLNNLS